MTQAHNIEHEIRLMKLPDYWPTWPLLPLKKIEFDGFPELGYMTDSKPTRVYLGGMWDRTLKVSEREFKDYDSIEDLAKIWRID